MDLSMPTIEDLTSRQLRKLAVRQEEEDEDDEDIYFEEMLLELEENDAISPEECGFMRGYLGDAEE